MSKTQNPKNYPPVEDTLPKKSVSSKATKK